MTEKIELEKNSEYIIENNGKTMKFIVKRHFKEGSETAFDKLLKLMLRDLKENGLQTEKQGKE